MASGSWQIGNGAPGLEALARLVAAKSWRQPTRTSERPQPKAPASVKHDGDQNSTMMKLPFEEDVAVAVAMKFLQRGSTALGAAAVVDALVVAIDAETSLEPKCTTPSPIQQGRRCNC